MTVDFNGQTTQLTRNLTPFPALTNLLEIIPTTLKNLAVHLHICIRNADSVDVDFSDLDYFLTKSCSSSALVHLYVNNAMSYPGYSLDDIMASFARYTNIKRLVDQGLLVISQESQRRFRRFG